MDVAVLTQFGGEFVGRDLVGGELEEEPVLGGGEMRSSTATVVGFLDILITVDLLV